jgi:hypothetical protein
VAQEVASIMHIQVQMEYSDKDWRKRSRKTYEYRSYRCIEDWRKRNRKTYEEAYEKALTMSEKDTVLKYCKKHPPAKPYNPYKSCKLHPPAGIRTSCWWKEAAESLEMDKGKIYKYAKSHVTVQKKRQRDALKEIDACKAKTLSLTDAKAKLETKWKAAKAKLETEWKAVNAKAANAKAKLKNAKAQLKEVHAHAQFAKAPESPASTENAKAELKEVNAKAKFAKAEESPVVAVS